MSSKVTEKELRRAERAEREQERETKLSRARRVKTAATAALALILVGAIAAAVLPAGSDRPHPAGRTVAASAAPFGPHYAGLQQRRKRAGVPTMMETMNSQVHYHPMLKVFANGRPIAVPANIGIDPGKDSMQMAGLHTHDISGTIHVEGASHATLGKFFEIWGVPVSTQQLGPYRAAGRKAPRMWVNGRPSRAFGALKLADGQRIVISFGTASRPPSD